MIVSTQSIFATFYEQLVPPCILASSLLYKLRDSLDAVAFALPH
jgi:hypothetical protein